MVFVVVVIVVCCFVGFFPDGGWVGVGRRSIAQSSVLLTASFCGSG